MRRKHGHGKAVERMVEKTHDVTGSGALPLDSAIAHEV